MKRLAMVGIFLGFLGLMGSAWAAGSCVVTGPEVVSLQDGTRLERYRWAWTSHTDGTVSDATTCAATIQGIPWYVETLAGSVTPDDAWDVIIRNDLGRDILGGKGTNLGTNSATIAKGSWCYGATDGVYGGGPSMGALTLTLSGANSQKTGYVYVTVQR